MAEFSILGVDIRGIAACVPKYIETVNDLSFVEDNAHAQKIQRATGVFSKRVDRGEMTTSDLCCQAADHLIDQLNWKKSDINVLVFISQTFDYIAVPATACTLQYRLGLSSACLAFDITLGCSGYPYGLSVVSSLLSNIGGKGLLLVGDVLGVHRAKDDPVVAPLFGAAGTATALESHENGGISYYDLNTDGSGYDAIIVPEGGGRHPYDENFFKKKQDQDGIWRNGMNLRMKSIDIINFSLTRTVESINSSLQKMNLSIDDIDYFVFHQANKIINDGIKKKLRLPSEKILNSLEQFGNTSSASIPLSIVANSRSYQLENKTLLLCGFGVGLSWGTTILRTGEITISTVLEYMS